MSEATVYLTNAQALLLLAAYGVYVLAKVVLVLAVLRRRVRGLRRGNWVAVSVLPPFADLAYYLLRRPHRGAGA